MQPIKLPPRDLLLTCEQIRQHLAQGGEPACWLAWSVVSSYRPPHLAHYLDRLLGHAEQRGFGAV